MKKIFVLTLIAILSSQLFAQNAVRKDSCISVLDARVVAYIPGQKDSLINKDSVKNGFVLKLSDTSFKVLNYCIVFAVWDGPIVKIVSGGDKLTPQKMYMDYLKKVRKDDILTVEQIKVTKKGVCYRLNGLLYFIE